MDEVEARTVKVPGVESATVNFAAGNATVRYDETRLGVADINALVHQRGHQSAVDSPKAAVVPTEDAVPASSTRPEAPREPGPRTEVVARPRRDEKSQFSL